MLRLALFFVAILAVMTWAEDDSYHYLCLLRMTDGELTQEQVWRVDGAPQRHRRPTLEQKAYRLTVSGGERVTQSFAIDDPTWLRIPMPADGALHVAPVREDSGLFSLRLEPDAVGQELRLAARQLERSSPADGYGYGQASALRLEKAWFEQAIDPRTRSQRDWVVEEISITGPTANRVDVCILGDGYTATQQDLLAQNAGRLIASLQEESPYGEYATHFNFHLVHVVSNESGADHPSQGIYVDTALDATYESFNVERLIRDQHARSHGHSR